MNITINQEQLDEAVSQHINKAVANALTGYKIQEAIGERLSEDIMRGSIAEALDRALKQFDGEALVSVLAVEMQKAVTSGVVLTIREQMVELVMRLRKVPDYDDEKRKRARAEILEQMNH